MVITKSKYKLHLAFLLRCSYSLQQILLGDNADKFDLDINIAEDELIKLASTSTATGTFSEIHLRLLFPGLPILASSVYQYYLLNEKHVHAYVL